MWKEAPHNVLDSIGTIQAGSLSFSATRRLMAISLAPEVAGYLDMLGNTAIHLPHTQLTEPQQGPSIYLGR